MVDVTIKWNTAGVTDVIRRGALRGVTMAANDLRNELLRRIMQDPKSGRVYTRRGVQHQASAPGEAPASDAGALVRGISVVVTETQDRISAQVNSGAAHAPSLEFGTPTMEPRPLMRSTLAAQQQMIAATVQREIRAAMAGD